MTHDAYQPNRTLIEVDISAPIDAIARRAKQAQDVADNADLSVGIALVGSDEALLNFEDSQAWRDAIAPIANEQNAAPAWRVTSLSGGRLIAPGVADSDKAYHQLVTLIDVAGEREVKTLTPPLARIGSDSPLHYGDALNRTSAMLTNIIPHLERAGVTLCLPVAHDGFLMSPPEMRELIDHLDSPYVAANIDVALPRCDQATVSDWLTTLGPRVGVIGTNATSVLDSITEIPADALRVIRAR